MRGTWKQTSRFFPLALLFLLLAVGARNASSQWPPWLNREEKEPIYPDLLVDSDWLSKKLDAGGTSVIDGRERLAYLEGHIPGAVHLPPELLLAPGRPGEPLGKAGINSTETIVCYASCDSLVRASRLFRIIEHLGADHVRVLDGGFEAWVTAGGVVERSTVAKEMVDWNAVPDSDRLATGEYVASHLGLAGIELIDARGLSAWEQFGSMGGHIPNSLPFDFYSLIDSAFSPRPAKELRSHFAEIGPRPGTYVDLDSEFILYDDSRGNEGNLGYLLFRLAGVNKVRYFSGGWPEWVDNPRRPRVQIIDSESLRDLLDSSAIETTPPRPLILFDVRHWQDFIRGHLPGAVNLPSPHFADSLQATLELYFPENNPEQIRIVTYCYGPDCIRSRRCTTIAARSGVLDLFWFRDGVQGWKTIGGKLVRSD